MPRKNERALEALVEDQLERKGFSRGLIEHQGSDDTLISSLMSSKRSGRRGRGRPEFLLKIPESNALLVVEIKDGTTSHTSLVDGDDPNTAALRAAQFAEDGVIHYIRGKQGELEGLREGYDVLGLAISAERHTAAAKDLRVTAFRALKQGRVERLSDLRNIPTPGKCRELLQGGKPQPYDESQVARFAAELHDFLRDEMELSKDEKPLLVSAIMLALSTDFRKTYYKYADADELADLTYQSVEHALKRAKLDQVKREAMLETYRLLKSNRDVRRHLPEAVARLDRHIGGYVQSGQMSRDSFDLLGHFYREFLRYTGGDKQSLGIVLTPQHICELFVALAKPRPDRDVVIDICAGTGGFLVAAMAAMIEAAEGDKKLIRLVQQKRIGGIEKRPNLFTVACANMILRGDGKSNIHQGDAIADTETVEKLRRLHPTVALLNPPYAKAKEPQHEFAFVLQALNVLERDGLCIALLPVSLATSLAARDVEWKRRLLESHTLVAVMSLPDQLFPGVGVVTCATVFRAHRAHGQQATWFSLWKDDGFRLSKGNRVEREPGGWARTCARWVKSFTQRSHRAGESISRVVTSTDEWIAEAYLEPDFTLLTPETFGRSLQRYALYLASLAVDATPRDNPKEKSKRARSSRAGAE